MAFAPEKWKYFERLVAAIHSAADYGADVRWNELIDGRQFDVTIRFRKGLYEYLTVVECKSYEKPVSVEKVEAFVTKSSDVHAHHAVMASTSGFQKGAQEAAHKHSITLVHVTDSSEIDLSLFGAHWVGLTDVLHIDSIELEFTDGEKKQLPKENSAMTYYASHILIQCGSGQEILNDVVHHHLSALPRGEPDSYKDHIIKCPTGACVLGPDDGEIPLKPLVCIRVRAGLAKAKTFTGPLMVDTHFLLPDVKVRNIDTGEEKTFSLHDLPLGIDTALAEGKFYELPQFAEYYYCDSIKDGVADIYLIESFQHGQLVQAHLKMKIQYANHYVPVSDQAAIRRLSRRLSHIKAKETKA